MFNIDFLTSVRAYELQIVANLLPPCSQILEIGAGMGWQARELTALGHSVEAVDLPSSDYTNLRVFPVVDYNGVDLPFADASFDVIFTSNVLEHVEKFEALQTEIARVLRPSGQCIHILPTASWRFWTSFASFPDALVTLLHYLAARGRHGMLRKIAVAFGVAFLQPAHGTGVHAVVELLTFRPGWWRRRFRRTGFEIERDQPTNLFYTGCFLLGRRLSFARRRYFARWLGSACHIYILKSRKG